MRRPQNSAGVPCGMLLRSRASQRMMIESLTRGISASPLVFLRHGESDQRHESSILYLCVPPSLTMDDWPLRGLFSFLVACEARKQGNGGEHFVPLLALGLLSGSFEEASRS